MALSRMASIHNQAAASSKNIVGPFFPCLFNLMGYFGLYLIHFITNSYHKSHKLLLQIETAGTEASLCFAALHTTSAICILEFS